MAKAGAKVNGAVRNKSNEVHCPNCGRIIGISVPGNNGTIRCAPCRGNVEMDFTGLVLSLRMTFRESGTT